eukprot:4044905-Prymnesium_polylepis.1
MKRHLVVPRGTRSGRHRPSRRLAEHGEGAGGDQQRDVVAAATPGWAPCGAQCGVVARGKAPALSVGAGGTRCGCQPLQGHTHTPEAVDFDVAPCRAR